MLVHDGLWKGMKQPEHLQLALRPMIPTCNLTADQTPTFA